MMRKQTKAKENQFCVTTIQLLKILNKTMQNVLLCVFVCFSPHSFCCEWFKWVWWTKCNTYHLKAIICLHKANTEIWFSNSFLWDSFIWAILHPWSVLSIQQYISYWSISSPTNSLQSHQEGSFVRNTWRMLQDTLSWKGSVKLFEATR